ncbi:hypothetical protein MNBD_GAMMA17-848 [hydrothermal vent metagenome]|uniref:Uncharacterized protein n=1 Tax=hydrothermal vent metagenome TaxID=652676 RepID=A0A3B0Z3H9_9ZZZZ
MLVSLLSSMTLQAETLSSPLLSENLQQLDQRYRALSFELYQHYVDPDGGGMGAISGPMRLETLVGPMQLEIKVRKYLQDDEPIKAIATIFQNKELVLKKVKRSTIIGFVELMLDHNEWQMAIELYEHVKKTGLEFQATNTAYLFAKFHFRRNEWALCLAALQQISKGKVSATHMDFYNLMYGVSLQQEGHYADAIEYYRLITPASEYQLYATLNEVGSQLSRDGELAQAQQLKAHVVNEMLPMSEEMRDYLSLMAGYHFLENQEYEAAREAFGRVSMKSRYFNRALLGVAFAATRQALYSRAFSYTTILKSKGSTGLAADEAYLLSAYILAKSRRFQAASTAYSGAVDYYSERIKSVDSFLNQELDSESVFNLASDINLMREYPEARSLFDNMKNLGIFLVRSELFMQDRDYYQQIRELYSDYTVIVEEMVRNYIVKRRAHLENYLSQSRFGLIQMFDTGVERDD